MLRGDRICLIVPGACSSSDRAWGLDEGGLVVRGMGVALNEGGWLNSHSGPKPIGNGMLFLG